MRSTLVYILAATAFPAFSVLAQPHGDGGGAGRFNPNGAGRFNPTGAGGAVSSTLLTVTSAAPVAATAPAAGVLPTTSAAAAGTSSGGGVDPQLIPPFGINPGQHATDGTANCIGDLGKGIPCNCPPGREEFKSAVDKFVAAGMAFPTGNTNAEKLTRLQTCIVTLQNFRGGAGSGVGCPAVSTTWKELQASLQKQVK